MLAGYNPIIQTCFGTAFTWGLTAAGASLVFVFSGGQRRILDGSLGFAAGVMVAATFWSLLQPAIELAEQSGTYGKNGQFSFIPISIGFAIGAAFVYSADILLPILGVTEPSMKLATETTKKFKSDYETTNSNTIFKTTIHGDVSKRRQESSNSFDEIEIPIKNLMKPRQNINWKRILLLIIAITIHNIPEGLAVGVAFGAVGKTSLATFENARNLAFGIGIQNFPEGLAVSLPLRGSGMSPFMSFFYGQLSGMVEPIAGIFGTFAVIYAEPILPYALAFAGGAMIYVVVDDIIPEAQTCGNGKLCSFMAIIGFIVMMTLDVGLG